MNSSVVFRHLRPHLCFEREVFWVVGLNTNKEILCAEQIFAGTINRCPVYAREVFRFALIHNAEEIILAHTHTSSNIYPSKKDKQTTQHLIYQSKILDIPIADHLIIHQDRYFSFFDHGLMG